MVPKRLFGDEDGEESGSLVLGPKRPKLWIHAMREVMGAQCMQRHLSKLEPFLRRLVQEEVHNALCRVVHSTHSTSRVPVNRIQAAVARSYRLLFQGKLPQTLFTGSKIEAEGKLPVQISVVDAMSNAIIRFGPLSSMKIDVLVIDGDFGGDGQDEWTAEEFSEKIVREREGRRPLLTGDLSITLNNGVGYLGDANFTDNSSWIRSRKFRLGARVSQTRCPEGRVQEAISEAFLVKDHRGELYKKHHPPSLDDEVWRLEKIGKDGAFHKRLADCGIRTVKDFLTALEMDRDWLRNLLGSGMSNKIWDATIEHARECVLDGKRYSYCQGPGVIFFDSVFHLTGAIFDQKYHQIDGLTASQKVIVNKLKQHAYKNPDGIVEVDETMGESFSRPRPVVDIASIHGRTLLGPPIPDIPVTQVESATQMGFQHQHDPQQGPSEPKDSFTMHEFQMPQRFAPYHSSSFNLREYFEFGDLQPELGPMMTGEQLMASNTEVNVLGSSMSPPSSALWDDSNGLLHAATGVTTGTRRSQQPNMGARISSGRWVKVMAALKWMSLKKRTAARRARIVHLEYPSRLRTMWSDAGGEEW